MSGPRRTRAAAIAVIAAALAAPAPAHAQQWTADVRAGELRYDAGPGLESSSALAGLRYRSPTAALSLTSGLPLSGEDPVWGALAGWKRLATDLGPVRLGADLSADFFVQRDRSEGPAPIGGSGLLPRRPVADEPLHGRSVSARAMPLVAVGDDALSLEVRAGGAVLRSEFAGRAFEREVVEADGRLAWAPASSVLLAGSARRVSAEEGAWTGVGLSAAVDHGRGALWGTVSTWLADEVGDPAWSVGASFEVVERVSLTMSARHDVFDPFLLVPERTSWGVGLSVELNRLPRPAPPVPRTYEDGVATIELADDAVPDDVRENGSDAVRIAGDFNDWEPEPMRRSGDVWRYTRAIPPGVYNYAFVTTSGEWFVPETHPGRKADGFGGHVAVLVVEGDR